MLQPLDWPFAPVFRELKRFCPDFRDGSEIIEGRLAKITEYLDRVKMSYLGGELQYQEDSKLCFSLTCVHSLSLTHMPSLKLIFFLCQRKNTLKGNQYN